MTHVHSPDGPGDCFGCKLRSIRFDDPGEHAIEVRQRDRDFARDNAAYRRLKAAGIQPKGVDKSAQLEANMDHKAEAKLGRSLTKNERKLVVREGGARKL